jgi:hypothetical protein
MQRLVGVKSNRRDKNVKLGGIFSPSPKINYKGFSRVSSKESNWESITSKTNVAKTFRVNKKPVRTYLTHLS